MIMNSSRQRLRYLTIWLHTDTRTEGFIFCTDFIWLSSNEQWAEKRFRDSRICSSTPSPSVFGSGYNIWVFIQTSSGGSGYTRKAFNDTWLLNLDNNRWTNLVGRGNQRTTFISISFILLSFSLCFFAAALRDLTSENRDSHWLAGTALGT